MAGAKTSLTWWSFADRDVADSALIRAAATLGYDGIELADPAIWPQIADAGLAIASHRGHEPLEDGLNVIANHDRIEHEILSNLALAQQWSCPVLIFFSGNRNGLSDEAGAAATAQGLARVTAAAEAAGVTLALELLNSKIDHPDYQCDHTAWGLEVLRQVNSPAVKLLYDVYHMQIMEGDIIRTIATHHAAFGHYHVAGNPGRHEPDACQELHYPPIYQAIAATGYDGYVGMEFIPQGETISALRDAVQTFRAATA